MARKIKEQSVLEITLDEKNEVYNDGTTNWVAREVVTKKISANADKIKFNNNCRMDKYTMERFFGVLFINVSEPNCKPSSLTLQFKYSKGTE